jgi:hypothetical protein
MKKFQHYVAIAAVIVYIASLLSSRIQGHSGALMYQIAVVLMIFCVTTILVSRRAVARFSASFAVAIATACVLLDGVVSYAYYRNAEIVYALGAIVAGYQCEIPANKSSCIVLVMESTYNSYDGSGTSFVLLKVNSPTIHSNTGLLEAENELFPGIGGRVFDLGTNFVMMEVSSDGSFSTNPYRTYP